ncbi:MAG: hypothetical protein ACI9OE_001334 [Mariniflexile sp.]|jgi:hypothetical protein
MWLESKDLKRNIQFDYKVLKRIRFFLKRM